MFDQPEAVVEAAAQAISAAITRAVQARGHCTLVLSGGRTPHALYQRLAQPPYRDALPVDALDVFWGDERWVPLDHEHSNYRLAHEVWLSQVAIPPEHVHPMYVEQRTPVEAASIYAEQLRTVLAPHEGALPRVDVALLGLGDDGHTASLFPESPALDEHDLWVSAVEVDAAVSQRLTLTLPILNAARHLLFVVTGTAKAEAIGRVLGTRRDPALPASQIQPTDGTVDWFMDCAAARDLEG